MVTVAMVFVIVAIPLVITSKIETLETILERIFQFVARIFSG
jgi:hypothetical protein